jgi:pyruvate dehydrogenase E1 component alpha subunit
MQRVLEEAGFIDEESYKKMDKEAKDLVIAAMKHAEESPWPDPATLEEDVFAP